MRLISGFGINDAAYFVAPRGQPPCRFYKRWLSMIHRCYDPSTQARHPTYLGCSVDVRWKYFTVFKAWMETQDWEGKELDKDLLLPGNKVYSPDTCVFIPAKINAMLTDGAAARGDYMIGVSVRKRWGKLFEANCGGVYLGKFDTELEAHNAWRLAKSTQIYEAISDYPDLDPRVTSRMIEKAIEFGR